MKEKKHNTGDTPEDFQPLGKDYPLKNTDITGEEEQNLAQSARYENAGDSSAGGEIPRKGPFEVPDDDLAGEGWVPPTRPGGGWEHPPEFALEERLEEVENPEDI